MPPGASRFCRVDGSSREPLPGSTDVAGSPRTSRLPSQAPLLGSSSPISAASPGGSQWLESNQLFMSQTLITIAGTSGRKPQAGFTIGSSVNAACAAFTKALADLGKQDGVQVNCIHPSMVDTDRQRLRVQAEVQRTGQSEAAIRQQLCRDAGITRFGTTQDVASLACFIVSKNGSWLHGASIDLDGGDIPVL